MFNETVLKILLSQSRYSNYLNHTMRGKPLNASHFQFHNEICSD